jgi:hypothetical protein
MNHFFKDAFEKRNALVAHLSITDNYFKSYESSDDLLVVFSNFIICAVKPRPFLNVKIFRKLVHMNQLKFLKNT